MKLKLLILFLLAASNGLAHDLYLQANPFILSEPGSVILSMYLAASFPGQAEKWRRDKTTNFKLLGPNGIKDIEQAGDENPVVALASGGTYVIGWSSSPSYITIDAKHFEEYVRAEGYANVLENRKATGKANTEGKEKYTRYLKTFIQVGDKKTPDFGRTLGNKIEIVPKQNPYQLKVGEELTLQVVFDGKPLANVRLMGTFDKFSTEHDVYAQTVQTDANGIARIKITNPGIWLVRTNHMMPSKNDPNAEWESFWANCSFQVR